MSNENGPEMDFDRDVFNKKLKLWKDRFENEWKDFSIESDRKFVFDLDGGRKLDICSYRMKDVTNDEARYSDMYFMLAKVGDRIVGFSEVGLRKDNGAEIKMGGIDVAVTGEIRGVGTRLIEVNGLIFQELANGRGDIDDVEGDENREYIKETLDLVNSDTKIDDENKKKVLGQMMMNRQKWLKFFGEGGKLGYKWDKDRENLYKRYHRGDELPRLNCKIESNETDLREELEIEKTENKFDRYELIRYFEADIRFAKEDFDSWPDGKLDKDGYKEKLRSLKERDFQEYFSHIRLTRMEFQPDAKFLTVQDKDAKKEAKRVLKEIEIDTGKKWQLEAIIETHEQNQKEMRIFVREKYCQKALDEVAGELDRIQKEITEGKEIEVVTWLIGDLRKGMLDMVRVDCEQQRGKFEEMGREKMKEYLRMAIFDEDHKSPWEPFIISDD